MSDVESAIDRLYGLPLDQFTPARNALAKELKRPAIKELEKPNVPAWAVNQLYWQDRATYDRLTKSAERLRGEHRKMLSGKSSDIREAEQQHRDVMKDATDTIRTLLEKAGQTLSPATLTAIQETLEALPTQDHPGRLTKPLKPLGFEALSGMTIKPALRIVEKPAPKEGHAGGARAPADDDSPARRRQLAKQREKEERERKERQREAERELKAAEAAMLRAEEAVKKAEKALSELRAKRDDAVSEYQRARLRAHE